MFMLLVRQISLFLAKITGYTTNREGALALC